MLKASQKFATAISGIGALCVKGVSEMLFPLPKQKFSSEEDPNYLLTLVECKTHQGLVHLPIVYGEIITGCCNKCSDWH